MCRREKKCPLGPSEAEFLSSVKAKQEQVLSSSSFRWKLTPAGGGFVVVVGVGVVGPASNPLEADFTVGRVA